MYAYQDGKMYNFHEWFFLGNLLPHKFLYDHHRYLLEVSSIPYHLICECEESLDAIHHRVHSVEYHTEKSPDREEDDRKDHIEDVECVEHREEVLGNRF